LTPTAVSDLQASLNERLRAIVGPAVDSMPPASRAMAEADGEHSSVLRRAYPALHPLIDRVMSLWCDASSEMLSRLDRDRCCIEELSGTAREPMTGFRVLGDSHDGGRGVSIVEFGSSRSRPSRAPVRICRLNVDDARWVRHLLM
jgi:hypothetical protein